MGWGELSDPGGVGSQGKSEEDIQINHLIIAQKLTTHIAAHKLPLLQEAKKRSIKTDDSIPCCNTVDIFHQDDLEEKDE